MVCLRTGFKNRSISPSCPVTVDTTEVSEVAELQLEITSVVSSVTGQLGEIELFLNPFANTPVYSKVFEGIRRYSEILETS